jgi:hypothetical protein
MKEMNKHAISVTVKVSELVDPMKSKEFLRPLNENAIT